MKRVDLIREIDVRIEPLLLKQKHDQANFLDEIIRAGKMVASYA